MRARVSALARSARLLVRRARAASRPFREPRALLAARREEAALRREYPALAADLSGRFGEGGRHALIVSLSDEPAQVRLEALLAKALQAHGGRVTVLAFRSGWRGVRLFRALGLEDFVFYDDFSRLGDAGVGDVLGKLEVCRTVHDYKSFEYRGARVGRQALSSVVRSRHEPRVDLDDPSVRAAIRDTVEYAVDSVHVGDQVLDAVAPDTLLMLERGYAGFGSIFDRALVRGVPVIQFQAAHRDDAFVLKRYTVETRDLHPRSLDESTWSRLLAEGLTDEREQALVDEMAAQEEGKWFLAKRHRHASSRRSPDELRAALGLDPQRKLAVLFSHILWDASMFYGRDIYPDQGRWFAETIRVAAEDDRVQWLVKLHPALYWKLRAEGVQTDPAELEMIRETVGELPAHMRLLAPDENVANTDLFRIVDVGVTIRGTVGIELPPLGVPVITGGTSDYSGKGFTIDAETPAEYEANLRSIPDLERLTDEQIRLARLYSFGIFCARPWQFESFALEYLPDAGDTLDHRTLYRIRTPEELRAAPDLAAFSEWVLESDEPDYVDERVLATTARAVPVAR